MASFEFKNRNMKVEIAGRQYTVHVTEDLGDTLKEFAEEMRGMADELSLKEKTKTDAIEMLRGAIDTILGENSFDRIFRNRKITVMDCADLFMYLVDEINEFQAK